MEYYDSITGELITIDTVIEKKKVGFKQISKNDYSPSLDGITNFIKDDFENPTRKTAQAFNKLIKKYNAIITMLKANDYAKYLDNSTVYFPFNKITNAAEAYQLDMGMPYRESMKEVRLEIIREIETRLKGNKHENPHYSRLIVGAIEKMLKIETNEDGKHECECGCIISGNKQAVDKHKKTKKHVEMMNRMDANYTPTIKRTPDSWWLCSCGEIRKGDEHHYKRHLKSVKCRAITDAFIQGCGELPTYRQPRILSESEATAMLEERRKVEMECYISPSLKKTMNDYEDDEDAAEIMADTYGEMINELKSLTFDNDDTSSVATSATPSPPPIIQKKLTVAEQKTDRSQRMKAALAEEKAYNEAKNKKTKARTEYNELVSRNAPSVATPDEYEEMKCECGCIITKSQYKYHIKEDLHAEKMKELEELAEMEAEEEYYNSMPNNNIVLNVKEAISV